LKKLRIFEFGIRQVNASNFVAFWILGMCLTIVDRNLWKIWQLCRWIKI